MSYKAELWERICKFANKEKCWELNPPHPRRLTNVDYCRGRAAIRHPTNGKVYYLGVVEGHFVPLVNIRMHEILSLKEYDAIVEELHKEGILEVWLNELIKVPVVSGNSGRDYSYYIEELWQDIVEVVSSLNGHYVLWLLSFNYHIVIGNEIFAFKHPEYPDVPYSSPILFYFRDNDYQQVHPMHLEPKVLIAIKDAFIKGDYTRIK